MFCLRLLLHVADIAVLDVFNVSAYLVFVCMHEYAAAFLGLDILVKEIFNLNESVFLVKWRLNKKIE